MRSTDSVHVKMREFWWVSPEPRCHARVLVGRVIVHDDMQIEFGLGLDVDLGEDADEPLFRGSRGSTCPAGRARPARAAIYWMR
jgi:hypothetical protein